MVEDNKCMDYRTIPCNPDEGWGSEPRQYPSSFDKGWRGVRRGLEERGGGRRREESRKEMRASVYACTLTICCISVFRRPNACLCLVDARALCEGHAAETYNGRPCRGPVKAL